MKILRIHLHPFGGVTDRAFELHNGLNIIEGPNEFGKSTLNNALWHALFTKSNLTPAKLKDTMGRWFPKPSGDHSRVTLEFDSQGKKWTLSKCWGAGASSSLKSGDSAAIADPAGVQERLSQLLHRNEATWRHVLFVNQAQLNRTIHELKENTAQIDDLQPLLAGAAAIPGDIAEDKLATEIDSRIEAHYSHWDRTANGPERGRGIDNPWANKIGPLLAAYYAMETTRRELDQVLAHEKEVDRINSGIREIEESIEVDREFVATGIGLKAGLSRRDMLGLKITQLQAELAGLQNVLVTWTGAGQGIPDKNEQLQQAMAAIAALDEEFRIAQIRATEGPLRVGYQRVLGAQVDWNLAVETLHKARNLPPDLVQESRSLTLSIQRLQTQMEAQKLIAKLQAKVPLSVTLTRGLEAPETIDLVAGNSWECEAEGKLKLELDDLIIEVASGMDDVQSLFEQLEAKTGRQTEILAGLELEDLAAVDAAVKHYENCLNNEQNKRQIYQVALQGKTEEEWTAEVAVLDNLPPTRSVAVLDALRNEAFAKKLKLENEIQQISVNVSNWIEEHTDTNSLIGEIASKRIELDNLRNELAGLPQLPDGYDSVSVYLEKLEQREERLSQAKASHHELKLEQAALSGVTPKCTAEELHEELEIREREFQRRKETGQALLRISAKLEKIVAERGNEDPMKNVETAIASHFHKLTCGAYANVRLDGGTPVEVTGKVTLETELLSQGTLGSLALATRLAFADLYLEEMQGFLILDDPFTDMDPGRRRAAGQCLRVFAGKRQVIFFTCHPDHARELEELAGAKVPAMAG